MVKFAPVYPVTAVLPEHLHSCIADDMRAVDAVIRKRLHSSVPLVSRVTEYIITSGGKRLRPALVLLAGGAASGVTPRHHELAAVVEFIHTATLLHDDVVDDSSMRRGQATANSLFGSAASVLVGDFVYSRAFQMMVNLHSMRVMAVLADATNLIAEGEVLQLLNCHDAEVSDAAYLKVIQYKTAKLFEAAARTGAILSQAPEAAEENLARYGMHLGTAFQLIDDVLDFDGNSTEIGKNLGDDLAEGKPTLPLLRALRYGTAAEQAMLRKAIAEGGVNDLDQIIGIVRQCGALDEVHRMAQEEARHACAALAGLPASRYRQALEDLAAFAVQRTY